MKAIVSILAICFYSNSFAGVTTGGISGRLVGPNGEIMLTHEELTDALLEVTLNGSINVKDDRGEKKFLPANYDFNEKVLTIQDAVTGRAMVLKGMPTFETIDDPALINE